MLITVGIALFLGFVSLGTWQVQRRAWKLALMERVEQRVHSAPSALPAPDEWPRIDAAGYEYRPVSATGHWLEERSVLTKALTELGAGFWLLTPLQLADGSQVLVNRGFTPESRRSQWLQQIARGSDSAPTVTITGLMRMSEPGGGFLRQNNPQEQQWFSRDVAAIARHQGLTHAAPFFVDLGLPTDSPAHAQANAPSTDGLHPGMTVIRFSNSHLVYAITWYGLALMVLGAAWLVRRQNKIHSG
ncbi:SURF1 family protein [Comamonas composti]|uniref:SURF1 family protein n=1 Tax=Comamonas composti TaxID=408558 RepID=UPI000550AA23|nr:SURF1 family protein [Comamonas composti]